VVIEVVLVFLFGGLDGCEGVFSCNVDVLVGVGETGDDNCTDNEIGFWRGTNWASWWARGSTSGFDEDIDDMTMSERRDPLETTLGVSYRRGKSDRGHEEWGIHRNTTQSSPHRQSWTWGLF
jgi:hypothetical protein